MKELITLMKYENGKTKTIAYSLDESIVREYIAVRKLNLPMFVKKFKINNKSYELLLKIFPEKQLQRYYSLIIFEDEKYLIDKALDEQLYEFHDIDCLTVYSQGDSKYDMLKKDILKKNIHRHKLKRLDSLMSNHVFDNMLKGCENVSNLSNEIKRMDYEFKDRINN